MNIIFNNCRIRETDRSKGPLINTVTAVIRGGNRIVLDRDITEYIINEDGTCDMEWESVYAWDGETMDYQLNADDFLGVESVEIEDDAEEDYGFTINPSGVVFAN